MTLPAGMVGAINAGVEDGTYGSVGDVIQAAMQAGVEQDEDYAARIRLIRARVHASINDPGPDVTVAEMDTWIDSLPD